MSNDFPNLTLNLILFNKCLLNTFYVQSTQNKSKYASG